MRRELHPHHSGTQEAKWADLFDSWTDVHQRKTSAAGKCLFSQRPRSRWEGEPLKPGIGERSGANLLQHAPGSEVNTPQLLAASKRLAANLADARRDSHALDIGRLEPVRLYRRNAFWNRHFP